MGIETEYQQALDYLYSFVDYSQTRSLQYSPEKFNLDRMRMLVDLLGNPERQFPVIHIAGTKGKGSTAALIASALTACRHKTGFYTSPHLQDFRERIQIDGRLITKYELVSLLSEMKPVIAQLKEPTFFELTTALAFWYFARQGVDVAVIEVGLGGRLDSTNVVDPLVTVITSISYDHMSVLGKTLSEIAAEKAGIIKSEKPIIMAPQGKEAAKVIERIAQERNAPLTVIGSNVRYAAWEHTLEEQSLILWSPEQQEKVDHWLEAGGNSGAGPIQLTIPLPGLHQVENAVTAYTALKTAENLGVALSEEGIHKGFRDVFWPGRFEVLSREPLVVIDSAHNRDSAMRLRTAIDDYLPGTPVLLLFGVLEDKDIEGILLELVPRVKRVITCQSFHPRAYPADSLVKWIHQMGRPAQSAGSVGEGLELAMRMAGNEMAVVITGSLSVSAEARDYWKQSGYPLRYFKDEPTIDE